MTKEERLLAIKEKLRARAKKRKTATSLARCTRLKRGWLKPDVRCLSQVAS
jgi:hypothetical protein